MKHFGYCDFCGRYRDFDVIMEPIPEVIEEWKKKTGDEYGNYMIPNGIGYNIIFKCMTCGNDDK